MTRKDQPFIIAELLIKQFQGTLTPEEAAYLQVWMAAVEKNQQLVKSFEDLESQAQEFQFLASVDPKAAWEKVANAAASEKPSRKRSLYWRYAAAAIFILLGGGILLRLYQTPRAEERLQSAGEVQDSLQDVDPGTDKALLMLADGTIMVLEDIGNGIVQEENGIQISKEEGRVTYTMLSAPPSSEVKYNTITTPVGGQYQIVLPDHSKVWLNSESSLRFPTAFAEDQRTVYLTGEGYFEVARNELAPFVVESEKANVRVLGTRFNITHYPGEPVSKVTLVEGAVQVSNDQQRQLLQPGQQALINDRITVREVDTEDVIAWKNGYFLFDHDNLRQIMHQLKRWYGVQVAQEENIPDRHFSGVISRNLPLSKVLHILEMSGEVKFKIEDKTIYIYENLTP